MGASYGNIWLPGINSWGMLHDVCDIYTYEKNMCGPIRTHKSRSTNWLINYMTTIIDLQSNHSHKKQIVWKHGLSFDICLCYAEIYQATQNTRDDFKKNIAFPEGNKQFAGDFVLIWMKQRLIWFNLQTDGTRNWLKMELEHQGDFCRKFAATNVSTAPKYEHLPRLVSQVHMMAGQNIKEKDLMCQIPIKMLKQMQLQTQVYVT